MRINPSKNGRVSANKPILAQTQTCSIMKNPTNESCAESDAIRSNIEETRESMTRP